jgi:hypothetical protein
MEDIKHSSGNEDMKIIENNFKQFFNKKKDKKKMLKKVKTTHEFLETNLRKNKNVAFDFWVRF